MSVPYGAWMGSVIEDSYSPPHALATEVSAFLADCERLCSARPARTASVGGRRGERPRHLVHHR